MHASPLWCAEILMPGIGKLGCVGDGSMQELGEKFSINNDPILHLDFFCAYQAGTLKLNSREVNTL